MLSSLLQKNCFLALLYDQVFISSHILKNVYQVFWFELCQKGSSPICDHELHHLFSPIHQDQYWMGIDLWTYQISLGELVWTNVMDVNGLGLTLCISVKSCKFIWCFVKQCKCTCKNKYNYIILCVYKTCDFYLMRGNFIIFYDRPTKWLIVKKKTIKTYSHN